MPIAIGTNWIWPITVAWGLWTVAYKYISNMAVNTEAHVADAAAWCTMGSPRWRLLWSPSWFIVYSSYESFRLTQNTLGFRITGRLMLRPPCNTVPDAERDRHLRRLLSMSLLSPEPSSLLNSKHSSRLAWTPNRRRSGNVPLPARPKQAHFPVI